MESVDSTAYEKLIWAKVFVKNITDMRRSLTRSRQF